MAGGRIRWSLRAALATLVIAMVPAAGAPAAPPDQSPARAVCPGSFQVLHDDKVAGLRLAAGAYRLTVADPARLTCARAARDLSEFLEDYDGKIRRPWTVDAAQSSFQRGADAAVAFGLARTGAAMSGAADHNGGDVNPTSGSCPGFFGIRHDDHVGTLSLPEGRYRITRLDRDRLSCSVATRRLASFLEDFDGRLAKPWILSNATGTFTRGRGSTTGFRVKLAVGSEPRPGSGGGLPVKGQPGECPASYRVLHRDGIDMLIFPAGRYLTFPIRGSGLSCSGLARLFRGLLARSATPRGYSLDRATGTFLRRRRSIFRVKPASPRVLTQPASR